MTLVVTVFGSYALWLLAGGLTVARAAPERVRMVGVALCVLLALGGLTTWTRNEVEGLGSHLSFPLSLFGWMALVVVCAVAGLSCLRPSPGTAWALLGPPALLPLLWFTPSL
ncbi:hypothetical protein Dcar01_00447 [Deinococcus carri]|uniref:Uncharacterized protein n=1 Tax=Deinococcus carri TaxID=1211323 RepID=A0ABP9W305_9DEIO